MRFGFLAAAFALSFAPPLLAQQTTTHPFVAAGSQPGGGFSIQAGLGLQTSRLGVRFGATYLQHSQSSTYVNFYRAGAVGATLDLTFDLTQSRFRPYVIGGWGLYRYWESSLNTAIGWTHVSDVASGAMIGGMGFSYPVGGVRLFTEARLHAFTNGLVGGWLLPVTAGLRF